MNNQLITVETAKLAKEKGFDIITEQYYKESNPLCTPEDYSCILIDNKLEENYNMISYASLCLAPSQSILQKWLREKHKIHVTVYENFRVGKQYGCFIYDENKHEDIYEGEADYAYEEALEEGLQEALKLI